MVITTKKHKIISVLDCKKGKKGKKVYFAKLNTNRDKWIVGSGYNSTTKIVPEGTQYYADFGDACTAFNAL
jgi:hypothetical protein